PARHRCATWSRCGSGKRRNCSSAPPSPLRKSAGKSVSRIRFISPKCSGAIWAAGPGHSGRNPGNRPGAAASGKPNHYASPSLRKYKRKPRSARSRQAGAETFFGNFWAPNARDPRPMVGIPPVKTAFPAIQSHASAYIMEALPEKGAPLAVKKSFPLFLLLLGFLGMAPAAAGTVQGQHIESELVAQSHGFVPGKPLVLGLRLKMEDHWHVYWKNPGDAGLPVTLDWTLPDGFTAGPIQWPYPERIELGPLVNYGYEGEILLPVQIQAPAGIAAGGKVELKAKAKWLVCKEICLPGSSELFLSLPVAREGASSPESAHSALFARALADLPLTVSPWTFRARIFDSTIVLLAVP